MYIVMIFCLSECSRATTERSCTSLTCIRTICLHLQSVLLPRWSEAVRAATRTEENRLHLLPLILTVRSFPCLQQQHWDRSCLPVSAIFLAELWTDAISEKENFMKILSSRLDEGRATEGQVLAGSPPQVRWSKLVDIKTGRSRTGLVASFTISITNVLPTAPYKQDDQN